MRISLAASVGVILAACFLATGCTQKQDPDQLRRETAQATSEVKQDAQAVVQGVREGLNTDKRLDLNSASRSELLDLPGIIAPRADKIIASRPFSSTNDLVSQHIVSDAEYDRIKDRIRVGKPSPSVQ
jgi:DNA uptake protein ComE-like DNA-binding protein